VIGDELASVDYTKERDDDASVCLDWRHSSARKVVSANCRRYCEWSRVAGSTAASATTHHCVNSAVAMVVGVGRGM
jgi:hypothetical protein